MWFDLQYLMNLFELIKKMFSTLVSQSDAASPNVSDDRVNHSERDSSISDGLITPVYWTPQSREIYDENVHQSDSECPTHDSDDDSQNNYVKDMTFTLLYAKIH